MVTKTEKKSTTLDTASLESQVKDMYSKVALEPHAEYHFEMGRGLCERLGYLTDDLDRIPAQAMDSFAGVGYYFDLADIKAGECVLDLGSGSGTDTFVAALYAGPTGRVIGIDMTDAQLNKANTLRDQAGLAQVEYHKGYIEKTPTPDESIDVVISNGVINLAPNKAAVFQEVARILRPGGRFAIADIVTGLALPEGITCNADLWAACIGGAMLVDDYRTAIEAAGLVVEVLRPNDAYQFISDGASSATEQFDVKSISLLAVKPA